MARLVAGEVYLREKTARGLVRFRKAGLFDRLFGDTVERHRDCGSGRFLPQSARVTGCGPRVCYSSRAECGRALALWIGERYGADLDRGSGDKRGGFDSINERYELKGKRRVRTLRQACLAVAPSSAPWCLDRVDLAALNETAPALEAGGYDLPDAVYERKHLLELVERDAGDDCKTCDKDVPF